MVYSINMDIDMIWRILLCICIIGFACGILYLIAYAIMSSVKSGVRYKKIGFANPSDPSVEILNSGSMYTNTPFKYLPRTTTSYKPYYNNPVSPDKERQNILISFSVIGGVCILFGIYFLYKHRRKYLGYSRLNN